MLDKPNPRIRLTGIVKATGQPFAGLVIVDCAEVTDGLCSRYGPDLSLWKLPLWRVPAVARHANEPNSG